MSYLIFCNLFKVWACVASYGWRLRGVCLPVSWSLAVVRAPSFLAPNDGDVASSVVRVPVRSGSVHQGCIGGIVLGLVGGRSPSRVGVTSLSCWLLCCMGPHSLIGWWACVASWCVDHYTTDLLFASHIGAYMYVCRHVCMCMCGLFVYPLSFIIP
jgi:hypothetical protein